MASKTKQARYIIIGAGPGGLQMGYFLQRKQRDYLILERERTSGSFFASQPRHRKLLSINKKHNFFTEDDFNWRHDWNSLLSDDSSMRFTRYSDELFPHADTLHQYLQDFATHFDLNISYNTTVTSISKDADGDFVLTTDGDTEYRCRALLLALGALGSRIPEDIEGIELATAYEDHSLDREIYRDKRVAIIGQGNSAFETAEYLSDVAAFVHVLTKSPVRMAWDTHFVGDLRAINNSVLDMYQLKSLHAVLNPQLKRITRLPNGKLQTHHEYHYPNGSPPGSLKLSREYDYIIRCTGFRWMSDTLFSANVKPDTWYNGKFPKMSPMWESANVENLFFVGGAMQSVDRRSSSGFIHGFRYNIRTLSHLMEERYEGVAYPSETFEPLDWNEVLDWMYSRYSVSAALFQLFGFLCDVLVISKDLKRASLLKEQPIDYVRQCDFGDRHVLVFTLEFGFNKFSDSSIKFMGPSDPTDTSCTAFLHPTIRKLGSRNGDEAEFHFGDSLLGRWDRPHGDGGAVMSYHYLFQKWIEENLGVDLHLPEPTEGGPYRKWSEDEIERWNREMAKQQDFPCSRVDPRHAGPFKPGPIPTA